MKKFTLAELVSIAEHQSDVLIASLSEQSEQVAKMIYEKVKAKSKWKKN